MPSRLLLLCLLALITAGCVPPAAPAPTAAPCPEIERGLAFLDARLNPALGLLNEAPTAAPHAYWLTNDNALAAYAYRRLGQPDKRAAVTAAILRYGQESSGLIEVLWGAPIDFPPRAAENEVIAQVGDDAIYQERHNNGPTFDDWAAYADLSFYGALNAFQQGRRAEALDMHAGGMALYDGAGFRDKAYDGAYTTFKLALAIYVGRRIQADMPNAADLHAALAAMQRADGGFHTHYRDLAAPTGDANTETTSLALLALAESCSIP